MAEKNGGNLRLTISTTAVTAILGAAGIGLTNLYTSRPTQAQPVAAMPSAEITSVQKDIDQQGKMIGELHKKQATDHDAITTLTGDVKYIKQTVDSINALLLKRPGP